MLPGNLVSDSTLIDETLELIHANGGRAGFVDIAQTIFRMSNIDPRLAASMVADLVENDARFTLESEHLVAADEPQSAMLADVEFVVLDVEATHERRRPARIIEIGAYRVRGGEILEGFETLVNPETEVPRFLANLTGISSDMLLNAPKFVDIVHPWLEFIGDSVLVAHNANFDLPLLNREIGRVFPGYRLRNPHLCTVDMARRLVPRVNSHGLDSLTRYFGFEVPRRHRAADDALATARVLLRLLHDLSENGILTLTDARSFQSKLPAGELQLAFDA